MNMLDKLYGSVHQAMNLTDAQRAKLAAITNRATRYEAVLVHRATGQRLLLCYTRKTKTGITDYIYRRGCADTAQALVDFCGAETFGKPKAGELMAIGDWGIAFSGRTQREAIIEGELPFWLKAGQR